MTRRDTIREVCRIVSLAYHSVGKYEHASDGFCDLCPHGLGKPIDRFRNDGKAIDFVRQAVLEKLHRDGIGVAENFDPETGRETVTDSAGM